MRQHMAPARPLALMCLSIVSLLVLKPARATAATQAVGDTIHSRVLHLRQADAYIPWAYAEAHSRSVHARQADAYTPWAYAEAHSRSFHARQTDAYRQWVYAQAHSRLLHSFSLWTAETPTTELPVAFAFHPPSPNPVRSNARLSFDLPTRQVVTLEVMDVAGRRVNVLADDASLAPGRHTLDFTKGRLPSGLYWLRFRAGDFSQIRRVVLLE